MSKFLGNINLQRFNRINGHCLKQTGCWSNSMVYGRGSADTWMKEVSRMGMRGRRYQSCSVLVYPIRLESVIHRIDYECVMFWDENLCI